jgi:hypothetical protein
MFSWNKGGKDMEVLSVQADDHQEQPFRVGPLLPEQIIGEFNMGYLALHEYLALQVWKIFNTASVLNCRSFWIF